MAGVVLAVVLSGCGSPGPGNSSQIAPAGAAASPSAVGDGATPANSSGASSSSVASQPADASESTSPASPPGTGTAPQDPAVVEANRAAGLLTSEIPEVGDGNLVTVPGSAPAPDPSARVREVAVQVEGGLGVDQQAFAGFVLTTLNDGRSWAGDGYSFARTDEAATADVIVVLASPDTSAAMCRPLVTGGRLSCREGRRAILTWYRWVKGQEDFGGDLTGYRQYVVNHEVGHFLGNGHRNCPGAGQLAPVMMQQTKGVRPCVANPWVHPEGTS